MASEQEEEGKGDVAAAERDLTLAHAEAVTALLAASGLAPDRIALLTAGEGDQGAFVLCAGEGAAIDLAAAGRKVAEILVGRGGGSGRIFQGKAAALGHRTEALRYLATLV